MSGIPVKTCTNQNSLVVKLFSPFGQYLVEAPFAAMTATSLVGKVSPYFAQRDGEIFSHSSRENWSSSAKFDGDRRWTAIFKSHHKCSIGFNSRFLMGNSRTFIFHSFLQNKLIEWVLVVRPHVRQLFTKISSPQITRPSMDQIWYVHQGSELKWGCTPHQDAFPFEGVEEGVFPKYW